MDTQRFRNLPPRQRALVALAVLLDGREGSLYLENDSLNGPALARAAGDLSGLELELRLPFAGTLLRQALREVK
jgi:hypothetical protein